MVITKLTGGLGNQMFQYAAGRALSLRNKTELVLDTRFFYETGNKQEHEQEAIIYLFPNIKALNLKKIDRFSLAEKENHSKRAISRYYNALRGTLGLPPTFSKVGESNLLTYQKEFHNWNAKIIYLSSDWQNQKYFDNYESIIRNDFSFPTLEKKSLNEETLSIIQNSNSISLHVRRGDYLSSSTHLPISINYYTKAIGCINSRISNPVYFIFSDDIEWCKQNLDILNVYYINYNSGEQSYIDMHLMSNCKHNIIANSSFSWWGAWLNNNHNKLVISPENWLEKLGIKSYKVIPEEWIIL